VAEQGNSKLHEVGWLGAARWGQTASTQSRKERLMRPKTAAGAARVCLASAWWGPQTS